MYSFDPGKAAAEGMPDMAEFEMFLPIVTAANKKIGDSWVDTVTVKGNRGGLDVNTTIIVTSRMGSDTTYGGEKSWRIQRNLVFTVSGVGEQQGMPLTIEGTGTGERTDYITSKGVYLGSALTQTRRAPSRCGQQHDHPDDDDGDVKGGAGEGLGLLPSGPRA